MDEPLLKLNRNFTDKELVEVLKRKILSLTESYKKIEELNHDLYSRNQRLRAQIESLVDQNEATEAILESGQFVKMKSHRKLQKRFGELEKRFWEIVEERDNLKTQHNP